MNFVKAKLRIDKLKVGDRLLLILDDKEAVESVTQSLIAEGHKILEKKNLLNHQEVLVERSETDL